MRKEDKELSFGVKVVIAVLAVLGLVTLHRFFSQPCNASTNCDPTIEYSPADQQW